MANIQPIIKWQEKKEVSYIEMDSSQSNSVFYTEKNIEIPWCYYKHRLYNSVYGISMPLNKVCEHKLPLQCKVKENTNLVNFTTYKNFIYVLHGGNHEGQATYYLDKVDSTTLEIVSSKEITRGDGIAQQAFDVPLAGSIMSINLSGTKLLIAGGLKGDGQANPKIYSISIDTAKIDLLFDGDYNIGSYTPYYESQNYEAVYVFPKDSHTMMILPYDGDIDPVEIAYDESVNVEHILKQEEENKLSVIGRKDTNSSYILFNIDLFTGEVGNFKDTFLLDDITVTANNRAYPLIYTRNTKNLTDIYTYSDKENKLLLIEKDVVSVTIEGKFKLDGAYERNNLIGMNILDSGEYEAKLYQFIVIHPGRKETGDASKEIPFILGNQVKIDSEYNTNSPIVLQGLYEYVKVHGELIRFNKISGRLELFDKDLEINCSELLWASEYYNDILVSVYYNNTTLIYHIDLILRKIAHTINVSNNILLHKRKTSEVLFVYNSKLNVGSVTKTGTVYLVGGESDTDIFQDINEISINIFGNDMEAISTIILPDNDRSGTYKAKVLALSDRQAAVLFGVTYKRENINSLEARIAKTELVNLIKINSDKIHYITPDIEYTNYFITTYGPELVNQTINTSIPSGEIEEAFILGNHVYFVNNKHRYAAEIDESRRIKNVTEFTETDIDGNVIPQEWTNIDSSIHYSREINNFQSKISGYTGLSYFKGLFQYCLDEVSLKSKYDSFLKYKTKLIMDDSSMRKIEISPSSISIIGLIEPSVKTNEGYSFDILFEKVYRNIPVVEHDEITNNDYVSSVIDKAVIISRVPCTPYRIDFDKKIDYKNLGAPDESQDMAFTYNGAGQEMVRDDYSIYTNTWQVRIANGSRSERKIEIVLQREEGIVSSYYISGDDDVFPFEKDLIPLIIAYGEMPGEVLGSRYLIFIDIDGNAATFDKYTKDFISVEGYADVKIPYLSGELIIFPSKTTRQGSIGKRVWAYSEQNPYGPDEDGVSVTDNSLV
jgi:predicted DNA-binding protein YlxM (UPF0122 family)